GVPPAFRKKTTLRIFSIKKAVILRIKRLFYT
ncbi:sodium/hydrogen exchanger family protein, partial [Bacillus toyonensis]